MNIGLGFQGIFQVFALDGETLEVKSKTPEFKNIVLNSGLNRMGSGTWIDRVCVGTGTAEPQITDIGLTNFKAASTQVISHSAGSAEDNGRFYSFRKIRFRFAAGAAQGRITEVGLGWNNANLWNKTLLKDENGQPTHIDISETDFLDVHCEVRCYFDTDFTDTITLYNPDNTIESEHTATCKFSSAETITSHSFTPIGSILGISNQGINTELSGWVLDNVLRSGATQSEEVSSRSKKFTCNLNLTQGNGEHKTLIIPVGIFYPNYYTYSNYNSGFQCQLNPPIFKDNTMEMSYDFVISWDRFEG